MAGLVPLYMSNEVINKAQVKSAIKMHGLLGNVVAAVAMKVTGFDKINNIYSHISDYQGIEFADELINYLNVKNIEKLKKNK